MCIKGYFISKVIVKDTPDNLWNQFNNIGGIKEEKFFNYFKNKELGYAIIVDKVELFLSEFIPKDSLIGFRPPQSFSYLSPETIALLNNHTHK